MNSSLNHVYRIVWNATLGLWQVASEATRGRGKTGSSQQARKARRALVAASALALVSPAAWAVLPTGGVVVAGQASIQQAGNALNIVQGSDKAAIDWQSFSIGQGNTVNFQQLSSNSVALNRVLGNDVSVIHGAINANGQVFLVNQNGVLFTPTAQVNVGGIVASTQNISTDDFMSGKFKFSGNSTATVENQGSIKAADGGVVALIAAKVINSGSIEATRGTVGLAAGNTVLLDLGGPVKIQVTEGALSSAIEQSGGIRADGGTVYLTAKAAGNLAASVINHTGVTKALTMAALTGDAGQVTGSIALSADIVSQQGLLDASGVSAGTHGGQINLEASLLIDSGTTLADGQADGGRITQRAHEILQSQSAKVSAVGVTGVGGWIEFLGGGQPGGNAYLSGRTLATGRRKGGQIDATAHNLTLAGATFDSSATEAGGQAGRQRVGGGWQGMDANIANALNTIVNGDTTLTNQGLDGMVVVWSDGKTTFGAKLNARGSDVEISGKENLSANLDGVAAKTLLLDPKNITIVEAISTESFASTVIANPQGASSGVFGERVIQLANENLIVADAKTKSGLINNAGRVYLFSKTGSLLATYVGVRENDMISSGGITVLKGANQNNFVINSPDFSTTESKVGAVTWANGSTASGTTLITSSNSLVGVRADDRVGSGGITALSNGNFVVLSPDASFSISAAKAGAVTFGKGATGVLGQLNTNSFVGTQTDNRIGSGGVFELTNGDYVISSPDFSAGRGAVTRVSGVDGKLANGVVAGTIASNSEGNSLSGGTQGDRLSSGGIVALSDGGFAIVSPDYSYQPASTLISKAGAVHWVAAGDSRRGSTNQYTKALVGAATNDRVGSGGVTALNNGAFVVASPEWGSKRGAATFVGNGFTLDLTNVTTAKLDLTNVTTANSLTGANTNDQISVGGITKLSDGNYVVNSFKWFEGRGAVTWVNGSNGHITSSVGGITSTGLANTIANNNSLVGTTFNDRVGSADGLTGLGGVVALDNGNYVVVSSQWSPAFNSLHGAVTWSGATGIRGSVSASNSLIGSTGQDQLGIGGVVKLSNGSYAIASGLVDGDGKSNAGLVAVVDGTQSVFGSVMTVSSFNGKLTRLTGANANELLGGTKGNVPGSSQFLYALNNGNLVVRAPSWNGNTGAVTWLNGNLAGTSSVPTAVSAENSLVGSKAGDQLGSLANPTLQPGVVQISDTHYAVISPRSNGFLGSVTFVSAVDGSINGTTNKGGTVNATNSVLGNSNNPFMGSDGTGAQRVFLLGELGANSKIAIANSLFATGGGVLITDGKFVQATGTPGALTDGFGQFNGVDGQGGVNSSILRSTIQTALNNGTAVTLKANNDITVKDAVTANSNATGALTLEAGRNINFNASVNTGNGNLTAIAGAAGHDSANRDSGDSTITLASGVKLSAGTGTINLIANNVGSSIGKFVNNAGATPFTAAVTNIYLPSFTDATLGGLTTAAKRYNTLFSATGPTSTTASLTGLTSGVNLFYKLAPTLTVTPTTGQSGTYGGTFAPTGHSLSGFVNGDDLAAAGVSGTAVFNLSGENNAFGRRNAGTYNVSYASGLLSTLGYGFVDATAQVGEFTVNKLALSIAAPTIADKTYDGQLATGTITLGTLTGVLAGETLGTTTATGVFADKDVARDANGNVIAKTNATVTYTLVDGGTNGSTGLASNYSLAATTNVSGKINPKSLTLTGSTLTASNKVYDGLTTATLTGNIGTLNGLIAGETLGTTTATGTFADKDAANGKNVTVAYTLANGQDTSVPGAKASNYSLPNETKQANITPKELTISGFKAQNKVYNGNTTATINDGTQINGLITADAGKVSLTNLAATFDTRNVGTGKTVTLNQASLTGAEANNYVLSTKAVTTKADITAKALTIAATAENKFYDGNTDAVVTLTTADMVQGDKLTLGKTSASFADKNVGNGKTVTISGLTLTGDDAGNYFILNTNNGATTTANITRLNSVTWIGGASGDWFDAKNWAGGAVPDLSNVANVIIPVNTLVSFNGMEATPVSLDSLGNQGALAMMAGALNVGNGGVSLGGFNQTGGSVSTTGNFAVTQAKDNTQVGNLTVGGNLSLTNTNGSISQLANSTVAVKGTTTLVGGTEGKPTDVSLNSNTNSFAGGVSATGKDVVLNANGALTTAITAAGQANLSAAGNLAVSGSTKAGLTTTTTGMGSTTTFGTTSVGTDLSVTSTGKVTQLDDKATLSVGNKATVTATGQDVTLASAGNNFGSVAVTGGAVSITDKEAIALDAINATSLTVKAGGAVTQNAAAAVSGLASVDAGTNNVTLDQANNAFGSVAVKGGAVSITDKEALALDAINAASLAVKAGGAVTQVTDKAMAVTGAATFNAGKNDVTLANNGNDFGSVAVTGGAVSITDTNGVALDAITSTSLALKAGGAVTQNAAAIVSGNTTVNAMGFDVSLNAKGNDLNVLSATAKGLTVSDEKGGVVLGNITATGNTSVTSTEGAITQSEVSAISVTGKTTLNAKNGDKTFDVTLNGNNNTFTDVVSATGSTVSLKSKGALSAEVTATDAMLSANGNLAVSGTTTNNLSTTTTGENSTTTFGQATVGGALSTTSTGDVSQQAMTSMAVTGATTITATGKDVNLGNVGNDFGKFNATAKDLTIADAKNGVVLGNITATGNTSVTSNGGAITQALNGEALVLSGTTTLNAKDGENAAEVTLNGAKNTLTGAVSATGSAVTLNAQGAMTAAVTAAEATLSATGNLVVSGTITKGLTTTTTGEKSTTTFGTTSVGTDLSVTSTGKVAQLDDKATLSVGNKATVTATGQDVTLANTGNNFGSVAVTGSSVSITDTNAVVLDAINATSLTVKAGGAVTQNAAAAVSGLASVDAGTNNVTLDQANNAFGSVAVTGGAVSITEKEALALDAIKASSLTVKAGAAVTQVADKALAVTGATSVDAGNNNVTLANTGNDFGSVGVTGGAVSITDTDAVALGAISATSLTVKAGGAVTQNAAATVTGLASVDAGTNNVTLDQANNAFGSVAVTGGAVSITDKEALALDAIKATSLTVKAGGAVTQVADKALAVTGATSVDAGKNAVTLTNTGNDFGSVGVTGGAVSITDTNAVVLDAINATSLTVKAGGAVMQVAEKALEVTGATTVDAGANNVTLANAGNDFNTFAITAGAASVNDKNAVALDSIKAASLALKAGGAVTQVADKSLEVTGDTTVDAGANNVTLANAGNDFNTVAITAGAASVTDKNEVVLDNIKAANLTLKAGGAVTQVAEKSLEVSGTTSLDAGTHSVTLANTGNDFGSIAITGGAVAITDKNAVALDAFKALSLTIKAGGNVTQNAAATVVGATSVDAKGFDVSLNNAGNDFNSVGVIANAVAITDKTGVALDVISATSLTVKAGGDVTQVADKSLAVTGATSVDAGKNAVTLADTGNDFGSVGVTGGVVSITDTNAVVLDAINATSLAVKAGGAVTQSAAAAVTGLASVDAGTSSVTLDQANNALGSVAVTGGAVSITDKEALVLDAISAASLTVKAGGAVTQVTDKALAVTGATSVDAGKNNVTLANTGNDFGSVGVTGGAVSITDTDAVALGAISATSLTVKAGGAVTQNAAATVTGLASVDAGTSSVTLDQANNTLGSVAVTGGAVSITDKEALALDAVKATSLTVKAGGDVTQVADKSLAVTGATSVDAGKNAVTLANTGNDFGSVGVTGGVVSITDTNAVVLDAISASSLVIKAGGDITQIAGSALLIGGNTNLSTTNDINLPNLENRFDGDITLKAQNVTLGSDRLIRIVQRDVGSIALLGGPNANVAEREAAIASAQALEPRFTLPEERAALEERSGDVAPFFIAANQPRASGPAQLVVVNGGIRLPNMTDEEQR